mmetsp:Transcript_44354/g.79750  ORF Transcript_44354/g.79750 Transcript_44354/m.79750 type:complete len:108 (-) Transcript_44354:308-631(-)
MPFDESVLPKEAEVVLPIRPADSVVAGACCFDSEAGFGAARVADDAILCMPSDMPSLASASSAFLDIAAWLGAMAGALELADDVGPMASAACDLCTWGLADWVGRMS